MALTAVDLAGYLLERGLISASSIVDGDWMVIDATRRNRNFKVTQKNAAGLFVKQIQHWDAPSTAGMRREATCYWLAKNNPDFAALAPCVPNFIFFDPEQMVLVIELMGQSENLTEYYARLGAFPVETAALLGRTLASYHQGVGERYTESRDQATFPKALPWILTAHQQHFDLSNAEIKGSQQVMRLLQQYAEFHPRLDALQKGWQTSDFINGDMKWDNCLVFPGGDQDGLLSLKVVDWEAADFGDGGWDVGAIFQGYITFWLMSMQVVPGMQPADYMETARFPIETMQPAIQAFWNAYADTRGLKGDQAQQFLVRSVAYAGARMIQTTYEHMIHASQLTPHAVNFLQVSLNILMEPDIAACDLLGLEAEGASHG